MWEGGTANDHLPTACAMLVVLCVVAFRLLRSIETKSVENEIEVKDVRVS